MAGKAARGSPWRMSGGEWWDALKRTWAEAGEDNIGLVAAGAAFYAFAAIIPLLAATVLTYGLIATPETVNENIRSLFTVLPADAAGSIGEQLAIVTRTSENKQGLGLLLAIALALYGASKGASSMVTALNIAYGEHETRGFVRLTILSFAMVIGGVLLIFIAMGTTAVLAFLESLIPRAPGLVIGAIRIGSYLVLAIIVVTGAAALYRFAPARRENRWVWMSPGALFATVLWLGGTAAFGLYVSNFGNYGATYGSLSAVIVLLTWLWLSAYVFLLGAELNESLEHESKPGTGAKPASAPAPLPLAPPTMPGTMAHATQMKVAARVTGAKLALPPALLAGAGMARLRRGNAAGAALLATAAALVWVTRPRE